MPLDLLRKTALFRDLSDPQLEALMARSEERRYQAGDVVVREGEEGHEMFIVRQGRVAISKAIHLDLPGRGEVNFEKQLVELGEGSYFGEIALLAADTRSATVKALTDLEVWVLATKPTQQLMQEDVDLGYRLLSVISRELCSRLRRSNEDVRKLMTAFAIAINR